MTVIICVRDPDASNEFFVHETPTQIIDVDFGRADLRDPDEFEEWATSLRLEATRIHALSPGAAMRLHNIVDEAAFNYGHQPDEYNDRNNPRLP